MGTLVLIYNEWPQQRRRDATRYATGGLRDRWEGTFVTDSGG